MKVKNTKFRILDTAGELIWTKSFHSVGLNEILQTVKVPKGSFYHYFKSKEHFGVELLKYYIEKETEERNSHLFASATQPHPIERLLEMLQSVVDSFERDGRCPSLTLKLASEVIDLSEPMRLAIKDGIMAWHEALVSVLDEAKSNGSLSNSLNSETTAACIRDLFAGAIQRSCILNSSEPMTNALSFISQYLEELSSVAESHQEDSSGTSLPTNLL